MKYIVKASPRERVPPGIATIMKTLNKECGKVPAVLTTQIHELKANLNIGQMSKKAKKGKLSPAREQMLREANGVIRDITSALKSSSPIERMVDVQ